MRNDDGSVLVEAAIVLPVMLTVIIGGLDLGLGMVAATRLNFATESAAKMWRFSRPRSLSRRHPHGRLRGNTE